MNLKESALALGNEGEACAAAAGITRLLIAYNLSETDIPTQERIDNPVVAEEIPFKPEVSSGRWYADLIGVVCEYNMCRLLVISTRKDNGRMSRDEFQIVGRKKNVEVVLYLVSFLANRFYQIGKKEYPSYRHDCLFKFGRRPQSIAMYLRSYLCGCVLYMSMTIYLSTISMKVSPMDVLSLTKIVSVKEKLFTWMDSLVLDCICIKLNTR
ncbi:hypothetical protein [uncultured Bacteroides sp.]|uniref:DUF7168 domain-containing protein n=1 Tax=uncultured Bacteroides sp. TaxID=162156 RepID=UPI00344CAB3E